MSFQTFSRRIVRTVLVSAAAPAIAAPAASARFDVGSATQSVRCPAPPPSSIAAPAGQSYETLRAACATGDVALTAAPKPVDTKAPEGFDWASAAIGGAVCGGLLLLLVAALSLPEYAANRSAVSS